VQNLIQYGNLLLIGQAIVLSRPAEPSAQRHALPAFRCQSRNPSTQQRTQWRTYAM